MKNIIRQSSPFLLRKRDSQYHNITRDFRKCIVPGFQRKSSKIFKESLLKGSTTIAPEKNYPPPNPNPKTNPNPNLNRGCGQFSLGATVLQLSACPSEELFDENFIQEFHFRHT